MTETSHIKKVLLDNCILTGAKLVERTTREQTVIWGKDTITDKVIGYKKKTYDDTSMQKEVDALVTVGRLIREGRISAFTYNELDFESFRRSTPVKAFYALDKCQISNCQAPIERSKFRRTLNFSEYISKGGNKDIKKGSEISDFNQIPFIEWLIQLDENSINSILAQSKEIRLTDFEIESFKTIGWLKYLCKGGQSRENYPDAFHLWTAERNGIDVFLTLEKRLPNIVDQLNQRKIQEHHIKTAVLRPTSFLDFLGISTPDDPPIETGKFYSVLDIHSMDK